MPKCSLNCNRGCGHDHSSKAAQSPSLVDIEVVRKILSQALVNMTQRALATARGELTQEELAQKDLVLADWLGDTFCGRNTHFETGPDSWNPDGLAQFIELTVPQIITGMEDADPDDIIFKACAIFVGEAYKAMDATLRNGYSLDDIDEFPEPVAAFIESWTLLFVGSPGYLPD